MKFLLSANVLSSALEILWWSLLSSGRRCCCFNCVLKASFVSESRLSSGKKLEMPQLDLVFNVRTVFDFRFLAATSGTSLSSLLLVFLNLSTNLRFQRPCVKEKPSLIEFKHTHETIYSVFWAPHTFTFKVQRIAWIFFLILLVINYLNSAGYKLHESKTLTDILNYLNCFYLILNLQLPFHLTGPLTMWEISLVMLSPSGGTGIWMDSWKDKIKYKSNF